MPTIIDSQNVVSSLDDAPDGLRAEIGSYYAIQSDTPGRPSSAGFANFNISIDKRFILKNPTNENVIIPTKKATLTFTGKEVAFRDQTQWREYVSSIITEDIPLLDHQFNLQIPEITNEFVKNYHNPEYEDLTKSYDSNSLLNYNLISYPHKDKSKIVKRIGEIETRFDESSGFTITNKTSLLQAMEQFGSRLSNYDGSVSEISTKQRNVFDLQKTQQLNVGQAISPLLDSLPSVSMGSFPYYYKKTLPEIESNTSGFEFRRIMNTYGKTKNILQGVKRDLGFLNRDFTIGTESQQIKLYDLISLITSESIVTITDGDDEIFLTPESEIGFGTPSHRFSEKVSSIRFLSDMRKFIDSNAREFEDIMNSHSCQTFSLGYKIEKYLDSSATEPIQTYYTNDSSFIDTQLKYGRRYIYKTKLLIGVLGSSYTYSNLFISQNETQMSNTAGEIASGFPSDFTNISSEKFRAYVDVEILPSFKIVEYEIDEDETSFVDAPTLPPQVDIFNIKNKGTIQARFSPNFFKIESVSNATGVELARKLTPLTEDDRGIVDLLSISKDNSVRPEYFTGIYEIYRTRKPPLSEANFADSYLTTVDDQTSYTFPSGVPLPEQELDNMVGFFEDDLIVNQKYYYAFRTLTYHGTPSNLTVPYEVELVRDSDEYKVNVTQYAYPEDRNYSMSKVAKRIMKITPNLGRLLFSEEESSSKWRLDDGSLLDIGQTRTFKIRLTSKHTGKKIDLNINFKLSKDDSFSEN